MRAFVKSRGIEAKNSYKRSTKWTTGCLELHSVHTDDNFLGSPKLFQSSAAVTNQRQWLLSGYGMCHTGGKKVKKLHCVFILSRIGEAKGSWVHWIVWCPCVSIFRNSQQTSTEKSCAATIRWAFWHQSKFPIHISLSLVFCFVINNLPSANWRTARNSRPRNTHCTCM